MTDTVYIVSYIIKSQRKSVIKKVFNNSESATKYSLFIESLIDEDGPYDVSVEEWEIAE